MVNVSFLKESLANTTSTVQLIILSQKQLRDSLTYTMTALISEPDTSVVYVSLTQPASRAIEEISLSAQSHTIIVDVFSREQGDTIEAGVPIRFVDSPSNLTGIQIAIENALRSLPTTKKIVLFDSLNALALYNERTTLYKFLYIYSNKMKLREQPCLFFITKESTDEVTLDWLKRFCDVTYDFASIQMPTMGRVDLF